MFAQPAICSPIISYHQLPQGQALSYSINFFRGGLLHPSSCVHAYPKLDTIHNIYSRPHTIIESSFIFDTESQFSNLKSCLILCSREHKIHEYHPSFSLPSLIYPWACEEQNLSSSKQVKINRVTINAPVVQDRYEPLKNAGLQGPEKATNAGFGYTQS